MSVSNYDRISEILAAFGATNAPIKVSDMLLEKKIPKATGYALVKALVQARLLERSDHGMVRLGSSARLLAFGPIEFGRMSEGERASMNVPMSERRMRPNIPSVVPDHWDRLLTTHVDGAAFRRTTPCRIGFANASLQNPWRYALLRSVQYGFRLHKTDISGFAIRNANDDPRLQTRQIADMISEGIDALIVSAADGQDSHLSNKLEELVASGFPVVALDRRPESAQSFVSFVTASDSQIGHTTALWLAEHLGGRGKIWLLSGKDRSSPALRRQSAALAVFAGFTDIEVEAVTYTGWTSAGGSEAVLTLLSRFGAAPDGVWCDSGLQGVGSIEAFESKALKIPPHTGGDINGMYKKALSSHVPFIAIDYPAAMGARAVDTLLDILRGSLVMRRVEVPLRATMPRGCETNSVKADQWAEVVVKWDKPDDIVFSQFAGVAPERRLRSANTPGPEL